MIRITVTTKDGLTPWLDFPDQASADAYIADITASEHWGRNAYTEIVVPAELDEDNNVVTPAVTQDHAAEWSYATSDVTDELAQQAAVEKGLKCQDFGKKVLATVFAINESNADLTAQDFQAIMADQTLQMVERLLTNGSLKTARLMISTYSSPYFTEQNVADILAMIDNSGLV